MIVEVITLIIILILCSYIIFSVFSAKDMANISQRRTFGTMVLWIILWVITILLTDIFYQSLDIALWTSRLSFATSVLITYTYYLFVSKYRNNIESDIGKWVWGAIAAFFFIISFTDLVLKEVHIEENSLKSSGGSLYTLFAMFTGILFIYSAILFYKAYKQEENQVAKTQMLYILVGSVLSIISSFATNLIFPMLGFKEIRALGPWGLSTFIFATYYSIIRYRFLSSRLLLSKFVFGLLLSVVPYAIFHIVVFVQNMTWGSIYAIGALLTGYIYSAIFIYIFAFAKESIENFTKSLFFNTSIDPQVEKAKLIKSFDTQLDINKILEESKDLLSTVFNTQVGIVLTSDAEILENYRALNTFEVDQAVLQKLEGLDGPVIRDEMAYLAGKNDEIIDVLRKNGIQCLFTVNSSKSSQWQLYIFLGDKKDFGNYSIQDIDYINSIVSLLSVALQRAYLHQQVLKFNETLQDRVNQATEDLTNKVHELEEARKKENDMIDIMGHELRTPASIVKMNLGMLDIWKNKVSPDLSNPTTWEEFDTYIKRIRESIDNEIKIINVLLTSAKLQGSKLELTKIPVNLLEVIETGIQGQVDKANSKELNIVFNKPADLTNFPPVLADPERLQEIVDHLINNAVKYTEAGSIYINASHEGDMIRVSIQDSGKGISKEDLSKLGQKFFRTEQYIGDKSKATQLVRPGGTGLGLYVVFELVKAHGGEMKVESEPGVGSTFSFTIPVALGSAVEMKNMLAGNQFERIKSQVENNDLSKSEAIGGSGKSLAELLEEDSKNS